MSLFRVIGIKFLNSTDRAKDADKFLSAASFASSGDTLVDENGLPVEFSTIGIEYGGPPDMTYRDPGTTVLWYDPANQTLYSTTLEVGTEDIITHPLSDILSEDVMLKPDYDSNDDGVVNGADQLTDGINSVTAVEARTHLDNTSIHFLLDDGSITNEGTWSSFKINELVEALQTEIDNITLGSDITLTIDISQTKLTVTTAFVANEVIDLTTGNGFISGTSTVTGDTISLGISSGQFNANNALSVYRNGILQDKGTDVIYASSSTLYFSDALDIDELVTMQVTQGAGA